MNSIAAQLWAKEDNNFLIVTRIGWHSVKRDSTAARIMTAIYVSARSVAALCSKETADQRIG